MCDSPLSFQSTPARAQSLSTVLVVQKPAHSVCIPSADADASVQDEQWVSLTRNLTLLPAQYPTEHDTAWSGNEETTMVRILNTTPSSYCLLTDEISTPFSTLQSLDEPPRSTTQLCSHARRFQYEAGEQSKIHITENTKPSLQNSIPCSTMPKVLPPRLTFPVTTLSGYLQTPDPVAIPTPPVGTAITPPYSHFSIGCVNAMPLDLREPQPSRQQAPPRRSRFTMGPRPDCEKCRLGIPGHYAHFS